jgi:hypothetical protein
MGLMQRKKYEQFTQLGTCLSDNYRISHYFDKSNKTFSLLDWQKLFIISFVNITPHFMDNVSLAETVNDLPELVSNLLLLLSDKEKLVVKKRFALDGFKKTTLESIGSDFSVTRERVRQIEKNALSKMKRNVFNTALRHIHDFAADAVRSHGGLLREDLVGHDMKKVLPDSFNVDPSCLHLAMVLHEDLDCVGNTINFHPYVRLRDLPDYSLKFASEKMVNQLHKYGNVKSLDKIHRDMKDIFAEISFDIPKTKSLINIDKRMTLLEDELVGLLEWRHIHPRTLRDKILYILRAEKKPMHFSSIAEMIEAAGFDSRRINLQAVHNELIRHEQFVLIGRGIYALDEWGYEKGTVGAVIKRVLEEFGELSQDEIVKKVLDKRQVKKITIVLALKNNDMFERVGRKRYKLKA